MGGGGGLLCKILGKNGPGERARGVLSASDMESTSSGDQPAGFGWLFVSIHLSICGKV